MVNRFTKIFIAATLVTSGLAAAQAEGLYIGGNVGAPDYNGAVNGINGSSGGTALKLYGGYQFSPNFALEGGLYGLGNTNNGTNSVKVHGEYLDGVGSYEFAPKWSALGSVGIAQGRFTSTIGNDSSPAIKLGVGLQYDLSHQTSLRLQYDHYHYANAFGDKPSIGEATIGVKFRF